MSIIALFPGDDTYFATVSGDLVYGVGGNDTLTASAGGNGLYGGDGDDVLNGGAGNDVLQGDTNAAANAHNVLRGFGGNDSILSYSWFDQINAGSGDDVVTSYAQITGQAVDGGTGNDRIRIQSLVNVNDAVHVVMGATMVFTIKGINGATYLNFEALDVNLGIGSNTIDGGDGNDRILTAYLNGTNATNRFDAGYVRAGGGDDVVAFNGLTAIGTGIQRMNGGTGSDSLSWTNGDAVIADLTINAAKGTMTADGFKFATFDAFENLSFRTFENLTGDFVFSGSISSDTLLIGAVNLTINTFAGDDFVDVQAGAANVDGGTGNDVLQVSYADASGYNLHGGDGNDFLRGGSGMGDLWGEDGDDTLAAANSHAQIYGGKGADVLSFSFNNSTIGTGAAVIDGGLGHDSLTLTLLATSGNTVLDLSTATITLANGTMITGVEAVNFQSGFGNDDITASNDALGATANLVWGFSGNDTLRAGSNGAALDGGFGTDSLLGDAGADILNGGFGAENDILRGNGGNDTLIGNIGRDNLTGGLGADHFTLMFYYETGTTAATRDLIVDFSRAQGDKIDLAAVDAVLVSGSVANDAFVFIQTQAFHHVAGELRYESFNLAGTANDFTLISGDINGDAITDFTIELKGIYALQATDFIL